MPPPLPSPLIRRYRGVLFDRKDQGVIVSGESGSGKTEATKLALGYLAAVAGSTSGVEQRILQANPILEAFGNAKTIRNNNSSRFGKLVEVRFDGATRVASSRIQNYLLEKSRLVQQSADERNYHIFYMLCAGADDRDGRDGGNGLRARLGLTQAQDYALLNRSGCVAIDGVDDAKELHESLNAMERLGFSAAEVALATTVAASVLHLGQVAFRRPRASMVKVAVLARP